MLLPYALGHHPFAVSDQFCSTWLSPRREYSPVHLTDHPASSVSTYIIKKHQWSSFTSNHTIPYHNVTATMFGSWCGTPRIMCAFNFLVMLWSYCHSGTRKSWFNINIRELSEVVVIGSLLFLQNEPDCRVFFMCLIDLFQFTCNFCNKNSSEKLQNANSAVGINATYFISFMCYEITREQPNLVMKLLISQLSQLIYNLWKWDAVHTNGYNS